jgi:hypothetical protein
LIDGEAAFSTAGRGKSLLILFNLRIFFKQMDLKTFSPLTGGDGRNGDLDFI